MLLNMFTVGLFVFCTTMANYDPRISLNVGTVLFNKGDIKKPHWSKSQLSLLRARKYFQTILPPPDFIDTFSDDYVNILLEYVRDAYSNIKREATDLETDSIMTAALSDTLGGYFKAWVLPVAKLDYYGGTISQDNIIKLFQFYSEIKSYLDTDGGDWYVPDDNFISSISINVAVRPRVVMENPCEQLAYFEKTRHGLGVPLPTVNWNEKSSTLFVPLKNVTLIPMIARDSSNTLVRYYDTAKNCLAESNPLVVEEFDTKFQSWLLKNIIPHLKDERLYLALGNVLSLLNMTSKQYDRSIDESLLYESLPIAIQVPSKKVTIILIILFLEIMWCIPALIYLFCSKKKKDCTSNVYLFIDQNKPDQPCNPKNQEDEETKCCKKKTTINAVKINPDCKYMDSEDLETQFPSTVVCRTSTITSALQLGRKKETYYMEFQGQYPSSHLTKSAGTGSRAYYSFKNQSSETIRTPPTPHNTKNIALKKRSDSPRTVEAKHVTALPNQSEFAHPEMNVNSLPKKSSHSKDSKILITPNRSRDKSSKNFSRRRTDHSKDLKSVAQNKLECQYYENTEELSKVPSVKIPSGILKISDLACVKKSEDSVTKITESATINMEKEQSNLFYFADTPTGCEHAVTTIQEEVSRSLSVKEQLLTENVVPPIESFTAGYNIDNKLIEIKSARPVIEYLKSRSKKAKIEVCKDSTHYFEMSIQKPITEISLNIGPVQITKEYKRSKIPKLANNSKLVTSRISERIQEALSPVPEGKRKSLIPQPKKKTLDDMALTSPSCRSVAYSQLNETF